MSEEIEDKNTFTIRPDFCQKFKPNDVKECIHLVLNEELNGKIYSPDLVPEWSTAIGDNIRAKIKELGYDRYKFVVQIVIGEQRGEAVKMGSKCLWDSDTDNYASDIYISDSLFCVATAFAVYYY
ncbi:Tctex1 domain-containing protein 2 [Nymphon striatum]|nr:Tctex1 domain-containing protein 2 [Nymphon striatum]